MPRTDPSRSSESATRHLFRHLFNEQEMLRNPYVGSAVAAGRLTMQELRARVAAAARAIEIEDRTSKRGWRGTRQAAALVECTLKRRAAADVASELGISVRQLFRERQTAWIRALRYLIVPEPLGPSDGSFADVECNRAVQLFFSGRSQAGGVLLSQMIAAAKGVERFMLAALAVELRNGIGAATADNVAYARSLYSAPSVQASPVCRLTMSLLDETYETQHERFRGTQLLADGADSLVLEPGVKWWMIRLAIRLLIAKFRRAVAAYDRPAALRTAQAAIALSQHVPALTELEQFDLRLLTARVDWMLLGPTPRMHAALTANFHVASANGRLSEVVHVGALLAGMTIVADRRGSKDYARTVLALANTLPEIRTAAFAYLNLVVAELDAGRHENAARLLAGGMPLAARTAGDAAMEELQTEYELLAREIRTQSVSADGLSFPARSRPRGSTRDPLRAAYCARVAALELARNDDRRAAVRQISEAWEIAGQGGDWMARRTIGRTYRELTRRPPPDR
ncbi:MAG TPA: hypothetical protein VHX17_04405 [Candidatus Cybelea sp.]|nr:hypothetical protein [Candidatus Cybelea sp.]